MVGTCAALLLQRDGHEVTVLERDPQAPPSPCAAWDGWQRRGVNQFRLPHLVLARFTHVIRAELPELAGALIDNGAVVWNPLESTPTTVTGGWRAGDERFEAITGRRPFMEATAAMVAVRSGVDIRRGVGVRGVSHRTGPDGRVDVTGVVTDCGEAITADLVVDAGGRRSSMASWLRAAGSPGPIEEFDDSGFVYYARHYRSTDGSMPSLRGPVAQTYGSIVTVTLPADHDTWSVVLFASARDSRLRGLADPDRWEAVVHACPLIAHWIDGEPITGVDVIAKIEDRYRRYLVDGAPVATGVVPVGDAWAATNPSLGRGISVGMLHAVALRDTLREVPTKARCELVADWQARTDESVDPLVRDTITFDRHQIAAMEAAMQGRPYDTDDVGWNLGQALRQAAPHDPDLFRGVLSIVQLLERGVDVLSRPGVAERAVALADSAPLPGPDREELLELATR